MRFYYIAVFASTLQNIQTLAQSCTETDFGACTGASCEWCWDAGTSESGGAFGCFEAATKDTCVEATTLDEVENRWAWLYENILQNSLNLQQDLPIAIGYCRTPDEIYGTTNKIVGNYCPFGAGTESDASQDWTIDRCLPTPANRALPTTCIADASLGTESLCAAANLTACSSCTAANAACHYIYDSTTISCTSATAETAAAKCCSSSENGTFDTCHENTACKWCYDGSDSFKCVEPNVVVPQNQCLTDVDVDYLKDGENDGMTSNAKAYNFTGSVVPSGAFQLKSCLAPNALWETAPDLTTLSGNFCPDQLLAPCVLAEEGTPDKCIQDESGFDAEKSLVGLPTCAACIEAGGYWVTTGAYCTSITGLSGEATCEDPLDKITYGACVGAGGKWCIKNGAFSCIDTDVAEAQYLYCLTDIDAGTILTGSAEDSTTTAFQIALENSYTDVVSACFRPKLLVDPADTSEPTGFYCPLSESCVGVEDKTNCVSESEWANEITCLAYTYQGCEACTANAGCLYDEASGKCSTKGTLNAAACIGCSQYTGSSACIGQENCAWYYRTGRFVCDAADIEGLYAVTAQNQSDVSNGLLSTYAVLRQAGAETNERLLRGFCLNSTALLGTDPAITSVEFEYLPYEEDPAARCALASEVDGIETDAELAVDDEVCAGLNCRQCLERPECYYKNEVCSYIEIPDGETECPSCNQAETCNDCVVSGCCWSAADVCVDLVDTPECKIITTDACPQTTQPTDPGFSLSCVSFSTFAAVSAFAVMTVNV